MRFAVYAIGYAALLAGIFWTRRAKSPPAAYAGTALVVLGFAIMVVTVVVTLVTPR